MHCLMNLWVVHFHFVRNEYLKIFNLNIEKPDECLLVSSLPDKALITLVDIARS